MPEKTVKVMKDNLVRGPFLVLPLTSLVAQTVKRLPTMWKTWVQSLGWEDALAKEMATHFSTLAWKSQGWRSVVGYSPRGRKQSDTTERRHSLTASQLSLGSIPGSLLERLCGFGLITYPLWTDILLSGMIPKLFLCSEFLQLKSPLKFRLRKPVQEPREAESFLHYVEED